MSDEEKMTFNMTVTLENPPTLWALVLGGANLPLFIAPWAFLLDSNAVTRIRSVEKMLAPFTAWLGCGLRPSMCGKAPLFRPSHPKTGGYAARHLIFL